MKLIILIRVLDICFTKYIIETTNGDIYHLTNNGLVLLDNIHNIVYNKTPKNPDKTLEKSFLVEISGFKLAFKLEFCLTYLAIFGMAIRLPCLLYFMFPPVLRGFHVSRNRNYFKTLFLCLCKDKRYRKIFLTDNKSQTLNNPFLENIFIDKDGMIIFKEDSKSLKMRYNIFDVLKEPKLISNTRLVASKNVHQAHLNSVNAIVFIVSIVLQITNLNYKKKIVFNYVHSSFEKKEKCIIRSDNNILINGKIYHVDRNIIILNVYKTYKHHGINYLQCIYGESRLQNYCEKKTYGKFIIWVGIFVIYICFLIKIIKRPAIIEIKNTILKKKGYQVCTGIFDESQIMIKVYNKDDKRFNNEISILKENQASHIVKYYFKEEGRKSNLIVLEETKPVEMKIVKSEIYQIIKVIYLLHNKKIIHNSICMENIGINKHNNHVLKNFEDSENLECYNDKENNNSDGCLTEMKKGTLNWRSPEIILSNNKIKPITNHMKYKSDVFSLGLLLYYNETKLHPFYSHKSKIEDNIVAGDCNIKYFVDQNLHDLIYHCLKPNYYERITTKQILNHPYFWDNTKKFNFFANISDFLKNQSQKSMILSSELGTKKSKVFNERWDNYLHAEIISDMFSFSPYKIKDIKALLRAIRNNGRHYYERPKQIQELYGSFPNNFTEYFTSRFPFLVIVCYYATKRFCDEELFKAFYELNE